MERYDYHESIKDDIKNYIEENIILEDFFDRRELENYLNEVLWTADEVTGNASGSYTFNSYKAEEYLCHNWDLLSEAFTEFGDNSTSALEKGAEYCDVTVRCYLLPYAISKVLDEIW